MLVKSSLLGASLLLLVPAHGQAPATQPDQATVARGQKVRLKVLDNDTGSILRSTLSVDSAPAAGTATAQPDGTILYANSGAAAATDQFVYRIANSSGQFSTGTVSLQISSELKIANPNLNVPSIPPATTFQLVNAFGTLSFTNPVGMASPPGDTKKLFVCQKTGLLRVVPDVTAATPSASTFLDVAGMLTDRGESLQTGSECGVLGLAFHPSYATNRYCYVFYSALKAGQTYQRVARFTVNANSNPPVADPASEQILIDQRDQALNHNGGCLQFGSDGYLYISVGDGGDANDTQNNAQFITKGFFSGILRIDVDKKAGNLEPTASANNSIPTDGDLARYSIPLDNPYVHTSLGGSWDGT
ncbi:MAG: hypothetical protein JWO82_709, partial [Akkermansiaceae bacterium]|nr:hypothetical protein [Akkermansiaceae bacterium]